MPCSIRAAAPLPQTRGGARTQDDCASASCRAASRGQRVKRDLERWGRGDRNHILRSTRSPSVSYGTASGLRERGNGSDRARHPTSHGVVA